jgi:hypothetical protein
LVIHNAPVYTFLPVLKKSDFGSNLKVLAFGFTEKRQFAAKTDRNSVFLGRKADIIDRLHIVIPFVSFYSLKKSEFWLKIQRC